MNCFETEIHCPYCDEEINILIDPSVSNQEYIEDCQVCCRPMIVAVDWIDQDHAPTVYLRREDE